MKDNLVLTPGNTCIYRRWISQLWRIRDSSVLSSIECFNRAHKRKGMFRPLFPNLVIERVRVSLLTKYLMVTVLYLPTL